jgi:succinate dehydrogenase/fumarate reductase cytochrome b subunit
MCTGFSPKTPSDKGSGGCGCGGHGHRPAPPDPRIIMALKFGEPVAHECRCGGGGGRCPRHYLAMAGLALGAFLVLHLTVNLLGLWPATFQAVVSRSHALGIWLPVLEVTLVFLPLAVHVGLGVRTLARERLKFGVQKHQHGSDLRQWLQRLSAVVMLGFLTFHLVTMHRWFGGRFDPHHAFSSASDAIWHFWGGLPAGHPGNLLFARLYVLGLVAVAYHLANGIATGSAVLGFTTTTAAQQRLWRLCRVAGPLLLFVGLIAWHALAAK